MDSVLLANRSGVNDMVPKIAANCAEHCHYFMLDWNHAKTSAIVFRPLLSGFPFPLFVFP